MRPGWPPIQVLATGYCGQVPPLDLASLPRRLNLGCGFDRRDGYVNVDFQDFHEPDLVADVRHLDELPDDHFQEVLAVDVLEHLERGDTMPTLREWCRVLAPGGVLRLQMPDVTALGRIFRERDSVEAHELFLHHLYGTQAYTGDYHQAGFTDVSLVAQLTEAGFDAIVLDTKDGWLLCAEARKVPAGTAPVTPLAVGFTRGLYPWEEGAGGVPFRWCQASPELLVTNTGEEPLPVELRLTVANNFDRRTIPIELRLDDHHEQLKVGREPFTWSRQVTLAPGPHRVRLHSRGAAVDAPGDARELYFRLLGFDVAVAR